MRNANVLLVAAIALSGCGGGGAGGGGGPASLFSADVTAQDLVAASYTDSATGAPYLVLGDVLGRGQAIVADLALGPAGEIAGFTWSPDHSLLAVDADPDGILGFTLFIVEPLTGVVREVSGSEGCPSDERPVEWAPDSRRLAFARTHEAGQPLFVVNADGSGLVEASVSIVAGGSVDLFEWSPDSTRLAIAMDADTLGAKEVYVAPAVGGARFKISFPVATAGGVVDRLEWSPDSSRVAYAGPMAAPFPELYVSFASGSPLPTTVNPPLTLGGGVSSFSFEWAPDGSRIAYVADQRVDERFELFTSLPDGTGNVRVSGELVAGGNVEPTFSWAPTSSRIAYVADQSANDVSELYTVVPDGSAAPVKVSGSMVAGGDVGGHSFVARMAWSPDASRIAYVADQDVDGTDEVYVTLPSAPSPIRVSSSAVAAGTLTADLEWSGDSVRLLYDASHRSLTPEPFVSPPGGPAAPIVPSGTGASSRAERTYFSFAGDRVVLLFVPAGGGNDQEVRSYDSTSLAEDVVIVPPTPSVISQVRVR